MCRRLRLACCWASLLALASSDGVGNPTADKTALRAAAKAQYRAQQFGQPVGLASARPTITDCNIQLNAEGLEEQRAKRDWSTYSGFNVEVLVPEWRSRHTVTIAIVGLLGGRAYCDENVLLDTELTSAGRIVVRLGNTRAERFGCSISDLPLTAHVPSASDVRLSCNDYTPPPSPPSPPSPPVPPPPPSPSPHPPPMPPPPPSPRPPPPPPRSPPSPDPPAPSPPPFSPLPPPPPASPPASPSPPPLHPPPAAPPPGGPGLFASLTVTLAASDADIAIDGTVIALSSALLLALWLKVRGGAASAAETETGPSRLSAPGDELLAWEDGEEDAAAQDERSLIWQGAGEGGGRVK